MYKAVIYCRLSREDGDKAQSNSIANQRAYCEDFLLGKSDINIVCEPIVDDGVSGVSFDRPGFKELETKIKSGEINCIVVRDLSRFSRNYIDAGRYLERIFPELGVRFISINDNYDSLTSDPASDSFILPFKNLINDSYCKDISVKIRSSLQIKQKNGEFVGAFCPYGYMRDAQNRNKLVIDENVSGVIRLIFSLYKDGVSIAKIAERLNEMCVLTPMDYKRSMGINYESVFKTKDISKWEYTTVRRILTNECYIGVLVQGKSGTANHKIKAVQVKEESERIRVENTHEALVSHEDFSSINEMLKRDTRSRPNNIENTLSGFLLCADCGATMTRKTIPAKGKKYVYYVCSDNAKHKSCSSHRISAKLVEETLFTAIHDQVELAVNLDNILSTDTSFDRRRMYSYEGRIMALEKEIERYNTIKLGLYQDYTENVITKEEYLEFKEVYTNIVNDKLHSKKALEKESTVATSNNSIELFKSHQNFVTLTRRVLMSLVDRVKIHEKHVIEIFFKYADEFSEIIDILKSAEQTA